MWLNPQYCQFAIDFSHLRHLNYWCANSTCEAEQQINLSESQRWEKWWKIIYLTCDLWGGLMEESRTADAEQQTHSACKGQGPLSFSCILITKFAKFPQLWCTLSQLYPADSCYQTKHISVWKKKKKKHGYSWNCKITANDASRHANIFLRHTPNKGEQAPCCWCLVVIKAPRKQEAAVPHGPGKFTFTCAYAISPHQTRLLSSPGRANVCTASISEADICCGHHREELQP